MAFGLKEVLALGAGAVVSLAPAEGKGLIQDVGKDFEVSSVSDDPMAQQIIMECQQVGDAKRDEIFQVINSLEFRIGSFDSLPNRAGRRAAHACVDTSVATYCADIGSKARDQFLANYETCVPGLEVEATAIGQQEEDTCTQSMYRIIEKG